MQLRAHSVRGSIRRSTPRQHQDPKTSLEFA